MDFRNKRRYNTPQLGRPDQEAMAWLHTFNQLRNEGGIPNSDKLTTPEGRNLCANLGRLHELFLENGGDDDLNTENGNLDAMDAAVKQLERLIKSSPEWSESSPERR